MLAAPPPICPTPTISNVFPSSVLVKMRFHSRFRWHHVSSGTRALSINSAINADCAALGTCAPLLVSTVTPAGTQSSGSR